MSSPRNEDPTAELVHFNPDSSTLLPAVVAIAPVSPASSSESLVEAYAQLGATSISSQKRSEVVEFNRSDGVEHDGHRSGELGRDIRRRSKFKLALQNDNIDLGQHSLLRPSSPAESASFILRQPN